MRTTTRRFTQTFLFLLFCIQLQSQVYTPVFPDLEGDILFTELVNEYTTSTVLNYSQARDTMYGIIDNFADTVTCVYTGHELYLPPDVDPSIHLFMSGSPDGINAEHTYPRSKGADEDDGNGNGFSDLHHLFPTRIAVNEARGNSPFLEIEDSLTTSWFYLDQEQDSIPLIDTALFSERIDTIFEPREEFKGNIARAIFYFFTIYKENALAADSTFFEQQRETLCDWHIQDPIDSLEWVRTYKIAGYQDDLPNPFILDSSLAHRTYCEPLPLLPLPVRLNYFKAIEKEGRVELNWRTTSEFNNHGFEIERSPDHQTWETIQFIKGSGTTQARQSYSFIDKKPFRGDNYFRLKQLDFDGKFTYSTIQLVRIENTSEAFIEIYPNPNAGTFTLNMHNLNNLKTRIRIFDGIGNLVWAKVFVEDELAIAWEKECYLPLPGMYFVVTEVGGKVQTEKVVVKE